MTVDKGEMYIFPEGNGNNAYRLSPIGMQIQAYSCVAYFSCVG